MELSCRVRGQRPSHQKPSETNCLLGTSQWRARKVLYAVDAMTNNRTSRRFTGRLAMSLTVAVVVFAAACSSNDGRGEQLSLNKPLFPTIEET